MSVEKFKKGELAVNIVYNTLKELKEKLNIEKRSKIVEELFKKHFGFSNPSHIYSGKVCSVFRITDKTLRCPPNINTDEFLELIRTFIGTTSFEILIGVKEITKLGLDDITEVYHTPDDWHSYIYDEQLIKEKFVIVNDTKYKVFIKITRSE